MLTTNEHVPIKSVSNIQISDCEKVRVDGTSPGSHSKLIYGHRGSHSEVSTNGQSRGWLNGDVVGVGVGVGIGIAIGVSILVGTGDETL